MKKTHTHIERSVSRRKEGDLIFASDYAGEGTDVAVRKSLSRLAEKGVLRRVAHGIYYVPKIDPLLGELHPSAEEVASKVAEKEKVRIHPTGAYALNKLGLSTQVPMRVVYLTDGVSRLLTVGKTKIKFKATTSKKLALKGNISRLVILALSEIDLSQVTKEQEARLRDLLLKEDPRILKHDLSLAIGRVRNYIIKLIKKTQDDRMVKANG